jgi:hypothetical protein
VLGHDCAHARRRATATCAHGPGRAQRPLRAHVPIVIVWRVAHVETYGACQDTRIAHGVAPLTPLSGGPRLMPRAQPVRLCASPVRVACALCALGSWRGPGPPRHVWTPRHRNQRRLACCRERTAHGRRAPHRRRPFAAPLASERLSGISGRGTHCPLWRRGNRGLCWWQRGL